MSEQVVAPSPKEVLERFVAAVESLSLETIKPLLHPGVEVVEPESLPYGGVYHGVDAFFNDLFPEIFGKFEAKFEILTILSNDQAAAVQMVVTFTSRRTGVSLTMPYVEVYTVSDGLIVHVNVYPQDTLVLSDFMNREA